MRVGSHRVTDEEWDRIRKLIPEVTGRTRSLVNEAITSRDKSIRIGSRKEIPYSLDRRLRNVTYTSVRNLPKTRDPLFELQWLRAVKNTPELEQFRSSDWNRERNRQIMYNAFYAHEPYDIRRHYMGVWESRTGEGSPNWAYEGWYDELEETHEEVHEEVEERPEA